MRVFRWYSTLRQISTAMDSAVRLTSRGISESEDELQPRYSKADAGENEAPLISWPTWKRTRSEGVAKSYLVGTS